MIAMVVLDSPPVVVVAAADEVAAAEDDVVAEPEAEANGPSSWDDNVAEEANTLFMILFSADEVVEAGETLLVGVVYLVVGVE